MHTATRSRTIRKATKKGIPFILMVVGTSGLGRTAFVNTLCERPLIQRRDNFDPADTAATPNVEIVPYHADLEMEDKTKISLTVLDALNFGEAINNENNFEIIQNYIETQFDNVLEEESRIKRNARFQDNRVHALIYFIAPTGHGLRELDIELMRRLGPCVNILPVIALADSLTPDELELNKKLINEDIERYQIPVYQFPVNAEEHDDNLIQASDYLRSLMPFAVVSSDQLAEINGQVRRARVYPWGIAEVDNPEHSDFQALRSALFQSHLDELREMTTDVLYENYRTKKLSQSQLVLNASSPIVPNVQTDILREEERLRAIEMSVQKEIEEKRRQLLAREEALHALEQKLAAANLNAGVNDSQPNTITTSIPTPTLMTPTIVMKDVSAPIAASNIPQGA